MTIRKLTNFIDTRTYTQINTANTYTNIYIYIYTFLRVCICEFVYVYMYIEELIEAIMSLASLYGNGFNIQ